tara:strand:+ start:696 stop:914 length:219 start_codon:yes stop_codon:yes gene_type:complete
MNHGIDFAWRITSCFSLDDLKMGCHGAEEKLEQLIAGDAGEEIVRPIYNKVLWQILYSIFLLSIFVSTEEPK